MRSAATIAFWLVSLAVVFVGALIASAFVMMATSMGPTDLVTDGPDTWIEAAEVCLAFLGLLAWALIALRLWHSVRFKLPALLLAAIEVAAVGWACLRVYTDYF